MREKILLLLTLVGSFVIGAMLISANGCESTGVSPNQSADQASQQPVDLVDKSKLKGGAQLWAENCIRCHNIRSPESYTDAQWDVALLHMRVRANLLAYEHRAIAEFLKSGN